MTFKGVYNISEVSKKILDNEWITCVDPFENYRMYIWGENRLGGIIGNNDAGTLPAPKNVSSPIQFPGTGWCFIDMTYTNVGAFLTADGTATITGNHPLDLKNWLVPTGYPVTVAISSPVQLPGGPWCKIRAVQDLGYFTINTNNELYYLGLCQGFIGGLNVPSGYYPASSWIQIPGSWCCIDHHENMSFGIKTDGTLYAWGLNDDTNGWYLGFGTGVCDTPVSSPIQIPGTGWCTVSTYTFSTSAIKTDGTLWTWGCIRGGDNGLGDISGNTEYNSPVQIPGTTWKKVNRTYGSQFATKTDGTLWSWGGNYGGQLGLNNRISYSSPIQIPGTTWVDIVGVGNMTARKSDNTMWVWGYGSSGSSGLNVANCQLSSPVQIPGTWRIIPDVNQSSSVRAAITF